MQVRGITTKFGENAGKIWSVLYKESRLKKDKLLEITQLNINDFFTGVGWLAKENKISKDHEDCYKLDNTNLETEIGTNAGKVWKILDIWEEADFSTLKRLSNLNDNEVHSALGWLGKEDKIIINEKQKFTLK